MTLRHIRDLKTPVGEILESADAEGVVIEPEGRGQYAVVPLDDDMLDYLLEHSPSFRKACDSIRREMAAGQSTHTKTLRSF